MLFDLQTNSDPHSHRNKVYMPVDGKIDPDSFKALESNSLAIAFWWALAKSQYPVLAYRMVVGEGYVPNTTVRDTQVPMHMDSAIRAFVGVLNRGVNPWEAIRHCEVRPAYQFAGFARRPFACGAQMA